MEITIHDNGLLVNIRVEDDRLQAFRLVMKEFMMTLPDKMREATIEIAESILDQKTTSKQS